MISARQIVGALALSTSILVSTAAFAAERIAIAQLGLHPQLQEAVDGFKAELKRQGVDASYEELQVNFDTTLIPQMVTKLLSSSPRMLLTIATSVTQGAIQIVGEGDTPIVFAAVTDPVAARIVPAWDKGGRNVTGAADFPDPKIVLEFVTKLMPDAKRVAFLYNPGEDNDVSALAAAEEAGRALGLEVVGVGVDSTNDIPVRVASVAGRADVIYVPGSGLLQPALPAIAATATSINIPIVNSAISGVREGLVPAAIEVSYTKMGERAGALAAKILSGAIPSDLPPSRPAPEDYSILINRSMLSQAGLAVPASLEDCGCFLDN